MKKLLFSLALSGCIQQATLSNDKCDSDPLGCQIAEAGQETFDRIFEDLDLDNDGIDDSEDNCLTTANATQDINECHDEYAEVCLDGEDLCIEQCKDFDGQEIGVKSFLRIDSDGSLRQQYLDGSKVPVGCVNVCSKNLETFDFRMFARNRFMDLDSGEMQMYVGNQIMTGGLHFLDFQAGECKRVTGFIQKNPDMQSDVLQGVESSSLILHLPAYGTSNILATSFGPVQNVIYYEIARESLDGYQNLHLVSVSNRSMTSNLKVSVECPKSVTISFSHSGSLGQQVNVEAWTMTEFEIEKLNGDQTVTIEYISECNYKIRSVDNQTIFKEDDSSQGVDLLEL